MDCDGLGMGNRVGRARLAVPGDAKNACLRYPTASFGSAVKAGEGAVEGSNGPQRGAGR